MVRLPVDWIGPREELVPVGPPGHIRAEDQEPDEVLPRTAAAFWTEDAAALHDALQGPATDPGDPPAASVQATAHRPGASRTGPADATLGRRRAVHIGAVAGLLRRRGQHRPGARWALLGLPLVALGVLALIGSAESPTMSSPVRAGSADPAEAVALVSGRVPDTPQRVAAARAIVRGNVSRARMEEERRITGRAHSGRHLIKRSTDRPPSVKRSHLAAAHHSAEPLPGPHATASPPTAASAPTGASPETSTVPPASAGPASSTAGQTATSARQPAFGENGSLAPGHSPDS